MIIIPFRTIPSFTQEIVIEDITYLLRFNWNVRGEYWTMAIENLNEVVLISGIKIVPNYGLTIDQNRENLPKGDFIAVDTTGNSDMPTFEGMGEDVYLAYITEVELETLEAGGTIV